VEKALFHHHLLRATEIVVPFSREFLHDSLPPSILYLIFPNQSYGGNAISGEETLFPNETLSEGSFWGPFDVDQVVGSLWRDGKIPEWINMQIHSYDDINTYLELLCCGRFTSNKELLYHVKEGYPPFHVLGPNLPPNWISVEGSGKFDLYWCGKPNPFSKPNQFSR